VLQPPPRWLAPGDRTPSRFRRQEQATTSILPRFGIIAKRGRDQGFGVDDDRAQTNPSSSILSSACLTEKPGLAWPMPMKPNLSLPRCCGA